jgi:glutamate racemase
LTHRPSKERFAKSALTSGHCRALAWELKSAEMAFAMNEDHPIGIFDSGIGGLTVLRALHARLPHENYVYLGDTARVPYGSKSPETVIRYSLRVADYLRGLPIKLLVVACNTASAHGLAALRETHPDLPIVGVVEPGAQAAYAASRNGRVAVLATEGTIRSGAYTRALAALGGVETFGQACPLFVPLAEEGMGDDPITDQIAERYLSGLRKLKVDTAILACTHYPMLMPSLVRVMGPDIVLVDSAATTAVAVETLLAERRAARDAGNASTRYLLTDVAGHFVSVGEQFLGRPMGDVELVDI